MGNKVLLKSLLAGFAFSLIALPSFAQEGRLPTKEELRIKEEKLAFYKSHPNVSRVKPDHHLMVTGPEQDCDNATAVCQQSYTQNNSYTGYGSSQEVFNT
ncbi:MAG: hypothetical protein ACJ76F_08800, partial [Bacteroidia bacterium]